MKINSTLFYSTLLYSTLLYSTLLYSTLLYSMSILATRQPVIVTGWRKLWRANNFLFFKDFTDSVSSRQFRDFSTTVYCNKRLVLYKQVTILCCLYSCSHVVGWYDDRSVVLPIKYAICRTASAARCRPGRCCAPYMGSGRKKWLAVFKS